MLLTVPQAFYLSLLISAARRIAAKASPARDTPGGMQMQYNLWLYHNSGLSTFVATCETWTVARTLENALQPALNNTPFYTKLEPAGFVDPSELFINGIDAFLLERDDFDTDGFSAEFVDRFNRILATFTKPRSA